jgi:nucleoid-associated protein YgaU
LDQNEEIADDAQGVEENGESAENALNENNKAEEAVTQPPAPAAVVQDTLASNDRGYVGGKAGDPIEKGLPESGSKMAYIVVKGDSLSKIAKRVFSDTARWRELASASAIRNPNLIYPGDVVYYQLDKSSLQFAKNYESLRKEETTVKEGETLSQVSRRVYGNGDQWRVLWRYNDQINDPTHLKAGDSVYYVSSSVMKSFAQKHIHTPKQPMYTLMTKGSIKQSRKA